MDNTSNEILPIGAYVQYVIDGEPVFGGICEYIKDGWVGIRNNGRLDEAPIHMVEIDPT